MKGSVLILFAVYGLTAAMVFRDRRAVASEEQTTSTIESTTEKVPTICAPETPCGWTVYKSFKEIIEYHLTNNYCICAPNTVCQVYMDDPAAVASVHRCMAETPESEAGS